MGLTTEESEFDSPQIQVCVPIVGPTHLFIQRALEVIFFFPGGKETGCEVDHSRPNSRRG